MPDPFMMNKICWISKMFFSMISLFRKKKIQRLDVFKNVDLVVNLGGHCFVTYGYGLINGILRLYFHVYPLLVSWRLGIPFGILGQSVGPIAPFTSRYLIRFLFKKAHFILVREELSKKELIRCGLKSSSIDLIPDFAFMVNPDYTARVKNIMQTMELNCSNYIVIVPRQWEIIRLKCYKRYLLALERFSRYIAYKKFKVVIIAHSLGPTELGDDRSACRDLYQRVRSLPGVFLIEENLTQFELAAFYGNSLLVVGTRLHAMILSFVGGVPAIGISYFGPKFWGIMQLFDMQRYVFKMSSLNHLDLILGFESMLKKREQLCFDITNKVNLFRQKLLVDIKSIIKNAGLL
jgi:polysaccharide pyruvyl transferase WcaK-like protein